ncbi:MAG: RsmE family RNA methyltransferase [Bdellovibrionota bacterium]
MSHKYRFIADFSTEQDEKNSWFIRSEELRHLKKVLRLKVGDAVEVFDGCGNFGDGVIVSIDEAVAQVLVKEPKFLDFPSSPLYVVMGALKSGGVDDLLPPLVELGADHIHVFLQKNNEKVRIHEKVQKRWERIICSSSKQSKRAWLPAVHAWHGLGHCLDFIDGCIFANANKFVFLPESSANVLQVTLQDGANVAVFGGEKGFDSDELSLLACRRFLDVSLGVNILRATTAVVVGSALLALRGNLRE